MTPIEIRIHAAMQLLEQSGYGDVVEHVFEHELADRPASPPPPVERPAGTHLLDGLLDRPEEHRLRVVSPNLVGVHGSTKLSPALRLLLRALATPGEPTQHTYTPASAERVLRAARAALAQVDRRLADAVLPPVVRDGAITVLTRRQVRVVVAEDAASVQ